MVNKNSNRGFIITIIASLLFVIIVILQMAMFHSESYTFSIVFDSFLIGIAIIFMIGLINSLKGLREPNTAKKIIGLIINMSFIVLYVFIFLANINNIKRVFE
jgi:hypothetical protein